MLWLPRTVCASQSWFCYLLITLVDRALWRWRSTAEKVVCEVLTYCLVFRKCPALYCLVFASSLFCIFGSIIYLVLWNSPTIHSWGYSLASPLISSSSFPSARAVVFGMLLSAAVPKTITFHTHKKWFSLGLRVCLEHRRKCNPKSVFEQFSLSYMDIPINDDEWRRDIWGVCHPCSPLGDLNGFFQFFGRLILTIYLLVQSRFCEKPSYFSSIVLIFYRRGLLV